MPRAFFIAVRLLHGRLSMPPPLGTTGGRAGSGRQVRATRGGCGAYFSDSR